MNREKSKGDWVWAVRFNDGLDYLFNREIGYQRRHEPRACAFKVDVPGGECARITGDPLKDPEKQGLGPKEAGEESNKTAFCGNIFIKGAPGSGKTKFAVQLLSSLVRRKKTYASEEAKDQSQPSRGASSQPAHDEAAKTKPGCVTCPGDAKREEVAAKQAVDGKQEPIPEAKAAGQITCAPKWAPYSVFISLEESVDAIASNFSGQNPGRFWPIKIKQQQKEGESASTDPALWGLNFSGAEDRPIFADASDESAFTELPGFVRIISATDVFRRDLQNRNSAIEMIESLSGLVHDHCSKDAQTAKRMNLALRPVFIVVDNLYALKPSTERDRSLIAELTRLLRKKLCMVCQEKEKPDPSHAPFVVFASGLSDESWFESGFCDVVVRFDQFQPEDYIQRVISIEKFRHQNHVRGNHPYKIGSRGLKVFPSIFSIHDKMQNTGGCAPTAPPGLTSNPVVTIAPDPAVPPQPPAPFLPGTPLFIAQLNDLLPNHYTQAQSSPRTTSGAGPIVFFVGPKFCYKSRTITNIEQACLNQHESPILLAIRFQEKPSESHRREVHGLPEQPINDVGGEKSGRLLDCEPFSLKLYKGVNSEAMYYELLVKQGTVYREEMLGYVATLVEFLRNRHMLHHRDQQRPLLITMDDMETTAAFFSFIQSKSHQDEYFVAKLAQILTSINPTAVIISCTVPERGDSPFDVERAQIIADAVLTFEPFSIFGAKDIVTISGQRAFGTTGSNHSHGRDVVPLAVFEQESDQLVFDQDYLAGFIGFHEKKLHRPGIELFLQMEHFQSQRRYTGRLRTMFAGFLYDQVFVEWPEAMPASRRFDPTHPGHLQAQARPYPFEKDVHPQHDFVKIRSIASANSDSLEDAITALGGRPLSTSVVVQIDEFMLQNIDHGKPATTSDARVAGISKHTPATIKLHKFDKPVCKTSVKDALLAGNHPSNASANAPGRHVPEILARVGEYVAPYYSNVLLVATNCESIEARGQTTTYDMLAEFASHPENYFDLHVRSRETMACLLLDFYRSKKIPLDRLRAKRVPASCRLTPNSPLLKLLHNSRYASAFVVADPNAAAADGTFESRFRDFRIKNPNGKFALVLWYSELRILEELSGVSLAGLKLLGLPGGGFTGDWFLGILQSSVSVSLAEKVIGLMTQKEHEFFRLHDGVGLPSDPSFYGNPSLNAKKDDSVFPATHYGNDITLRDVLRIYRRAHSRLELYNYSGIRIPLWRYVSRICRYNEVKSADPGCDLELYLKREWERFRAAMAYWGEGSVQPECSEQSS